MSTTQKALHSECLAWLQSVDARSAFEYLVAYGHTLPGYTCFLHRQGYLRTYRYMHDEGWPFGFIVNRKSLLFYFRKAGVANAPADFETLTKHFPQVLRNPRGEIKVRLETAAHARRMMALLFGKPEP